MKKKIISLFAALAIILTLIPAAFAAPADYIGSYYTNNIDGTGYAAMDILSCTDSSITVRFKRIKNDVESYTYTFDTGTVSGSTAVIPFHAVTTATGSTFDGTMTLTFGGLVKVQLISSLGTEMYTGSLPKVDRSYFTDDTQSPTTPAAPAATPKPAANVQIKINGDTLSFEAGQKPYIDDSTNRTFIPLRALLTSMGVNVYWDEYQKNDILNEQLITCIKNNTILQFARTFNTTGYNAWSLKKWVDEFTSSDNYTSLDITELQPVIGGDKSFVPLRIISEAFGADVSWDSDTSIVSIICDTNNAYWYDTDTIGKIEDFTSGNAKSYITDEYTSIVPDSTPYFAPSSKFYLFDAIDTYGAVSLRIYYGGYIDVLAAANEAQLTAETEDGTADTVGTETETY
ncbi:MAG: copper amine oxidase N-terminal domain-containing protein [Candidatus Ornithomonoglobus sp.]